MKTIFSLGLILIFSSNAFALDRTLICNLKSESVTPWYSFTLTFEEDRNIALSWYQYPFYGAEIVSTPQTNLELQKSRYIYEQNNDLYIEWGWEAEAGYATLKKISSDQYDGRINFPNNGPAGFEDEAPAYVSCRFSSQLATYNHDIYGAIVDIVTQKFDANAVGDACVVYVQTLEITYDGKIQAVRRTLGFVTDYKMCIEELDERNFVGKKVLIPRGRLLPLTEPSRLNVLTAYKPDAVYFKGDILVFVIPL